mmetsp:Transcript_50869/g.114408  ORF Transcript_50869/g.114408 Transcript_50869/m.114408 type:complete len:513 (-) Transcript_50869:25-1563(-)
MSPCPRRAAVLGLYAASQLQDTKGTSVTIDEVGSGLAPTPAHEPRIEWLHPAPQPPSKRRPGATSTKKKKRRKKKALKRKARDRIGSARKGPNLHQKVYRAKRKKKRKRKSKNKRLTWPKKYGLLRHFVSKWPWWTARLEVLTVYSMQQMLATALAAGFALETSVAVASPWASSSKKTMFEHHRGAPLRLGAMMCDVALPVAAALQTWLWVLGLPCLPDPAWCWLRRMSVLQSMASTLLHVTSVVRWKYRPGVYQAPALFSLLAYSVVPWSSFCVWLVSLEPGDHLQGGGAGIDLSVLLAIFLFRAVLFRRYGLPRVPKAPRRLEAWLFDATLLGLLIACFHYAVLRNKIFEDCKNWKYVLCGASLAGAVFAWRTVVDFFRQEAREVKPARSKHRASTSSKGQSTAVTQEHIRRTVSAARTRSRWCAEEGDACGDRGSRSYRGPWGILPPKPAGNSKEQTATQSGSAGCAALAVAEPRLPVLGPEVTEASEPGALDDKEPEQLVLSDSPKAT